MCIYTSEVCVWCAYTYLYWSNIWYWDNMRCVYTQYLICVYIYKHKWCVYTHLKCVYDVCIHTYIEVICDVKTKCDVYIHNTWCAYKYSNNMSRVHTYTSIRIHIFSYMFICIFISLIDTFTCTFRRARGHESHLRAVVLQL